MKKSLCPLFLVMIFTSAFSQTLPPAMDSLYIVTYTTGPSWDFAKKPAEQPYFKEHSANLGKLRKDGVIKIGARSGEKGIIVLAAGSLQVATEMIFNDPAVANKLFLADVQKFNVFYYGCIEKPK